ncbi:TraE/TraK family type IV conjugative transfer system protein [Vreelandella massiliensis]|uniref:TraE/TraK family type IV conjugative transfer system protein n=1 Tax=Vreelandella massiliensis TaxID=1816686 RepID=UPI00096A6A9B|nr:TraE/TraK family type IV conjugative transfer system protein [Halomonas massiliensis]
MKLSKYLDTFHGAMSENRFSRIAILGLSAALVVTAVASFNKDAVVTIQPYTLTEEAWITQANASQSYKEAWGLMLATMTGNVTPSTLDFVRERIQPLLSPDVYQDAMEALELQANYIRNDRISMRFEPREVIYSEDSNTVLVTGDSYMISPNGESIRDRRTYEYVIDIRNYAPVVSYINTYTGRPRLD